MIRSVQYSIYRGQHSIQCSQQSTASQLPRTCTEAALQARVSLRKFRETSSTNDNNTTSTQQQKGPYRLSIRLPLPCPSESDDTIKAFDEGEWPGGVQQKFRALRPLVETLLEGYQPEFVGMLESPADGIGVWKACDGTLTVATLVTNATFAPFAKLCRGEFGRRVLEDSHTLIVVNPSWTSSKDIGQFWDTKLKQQAADLIDSNPDWRSLYHLEDVRTAAGATGLLYYNKDVWQLYDTWVSGGEPTEPGELVLESAEKPSKQMMITALNAAREKNKAAGIEQPKTLQWWKF